MSSQQTTSVCPKPDLPLLSEYKDPKKGLLAAIWHASARADVEKLDSLRDAALSSPQTEEAKDFAVRCINHAFSSAIKYHQNAVLEHLYGHGLSPNREQLVSVIQGGDIAATKIFLEYGTDVNNREALVAAVRQGDEFIDLFLAHGPDLNSEVEDRRDHQDNPAHNGYFMDNKGISPIEAAAASKSLAMVKKLVEHGANVKLGNALHLAAAASASDRDPAETQTIIDYLVSLGCDVNAHDDQFAKLTRGRPLHYATRSPGREKNIEVLLKHGADPGGRNYAGKTPLDVAEWEGTTPAELRELLQNKKGEDLQGINEMYEYAYNWFSPISWPAGESWKKHANSQTAQK